MILSQLISELQKLQALHGDLPVAVTDSEGDPNSHDITAEARNERMWSRDEDGIFHFEPKQFIYIF